MRYFCVLIPTDHDAHLQLKVVRNVTKKLRSFFFVECIRETDITDAAVPHMGKMQSAIL